MSSEYPRYEIKGIKAIKETIKALMSFYEVIPLSFNLIVYTINMTENKRGIATGRFLLSVNLTAENNKAVSIIKKYDARTYFLVPSKPKKNITEQYI